MGVMSIVGFRNWQAYSVLGVADTHQLQGEYLASQKALQQERRSRLTISQQDLLSKIDANLAPVIIDVRTRGEYDTGHVPSAINIDYRDLPQKLGEIPGPRDQLIIIYCRTGIRASVAEKILRDAGFTSVRNLEGDMMAWQANHLPLE